MKIKPKVRTEREIENLVSSFGGTWVRRNNARKKLTEWSNELILKDINLQKEMIRKLKCEGAKEFDLSPHYAEITKLELQLL